MIAANRAAVAQHEPQSPTPPGTTAMAEQIPEGFGPILRGSPVLDALGGFHSMGTGAALQIGLQVGECHCNSGGTVTGAILATLAEAQIAWANVAVPAAELDAKTDGRAQWVLSRSSASIQKHTPNWTGR
jgi:hypothetical protein